MSLTYAQYQQALTILAAQASAASGYSLTNAPDFSNMIPNFLDYAEDRIYRECVFLAARAQDSSLQFSGTTRTLNLAAASTIILVVEGVAAITPTGTAPGAGTRQQFSPASLDLIDTVWPQESLTVDPSAVTDRWWAMRDASTIVVAPTPNDTYTAEITGMFRPLQLSGSNPTTYLSLNYPDLLLAASMISVAAYLRDYGAESEDPKLAQSWESQYGKLQQSAMAEEQRRRSQGAGWSANLPTPLATPQRT